jgi:PAS domain S-box-containing protein
VNTGTIIIIDDDAAFCDNLEDILQESGYKTFSAGTYAKGQTLAYEINPHVVLLDIILPDGLGTMLLHDIKRAAPDCVCIMITAHADIDTAISALENGAFQYLQKPVRPEELLQLLERAFELVRLREDKKRAEEALQDSEEKYRTLVENVNIGVYRNSLGSQGWFIQANPAMLKIFGYDSFEEFRNIFVSDFYRNPEERKLFIEEILKKGFVKDKEIRLLKKDGTPIWASVTASLQYDEKGNVKWLDGVLEDITERKLLEDQLRQAQKMEAIGTLAGGIAHDFNNVLTAIIGYGNLLKDKIEKDMHSRKYMDIILASADRAAILVRSLLAFSRKQNLNIEPVDLNEIIVHLNTLLLRIIEENIELKIAVSPEVLTIMADAGQMEQVLMNLATNARDAMPNGGILSIETKYAELGGEYLKMHSYVKPGGYALLSVSDTGTGMDENTKQRIFEPFFTTKEVGKGTGLGLAMIYGIIKQHDGYIDVYSEPGEGTAFKIYIPIINAAVNESGPVTVEHPLEGGTETILIAEDDNVVRNFTKDILEGHGYEIIEAVDGEDAVNKFTGNKDRVKMLILDVIMPKKDGREVFDEIKKIQPDIKAIFMSGYTADVIHRRGIIEEGLNFVSKPISPAELLRKIRGALDQ